MPQPPVFVRLPGDRFEPPTRIWRMTVFVDA